jgi:hypothetical protein
MSLEGKDPCELAEIVHEKPLDGVFEEKLFGSDSGNTLWVKFSDKDGVTEWIGKFATGASSSSRVDKVIQPDRFFISAGGFGYLVDATNRKLLNHHFEDFTQDVVFDAQTNRFIVADFVRLRILDSGKVVWASERIALDGIRALKMEGRKVQGLAVTGFNGEESVFTFDLDTLEVKCPVDYSSWDKVLDKSKKK